MIRKNILLVMGIFAALSLGLGIISYCMRTDDAGPQYESSYDASEGLNDEDAKDDNILSSSASPSASPDNEDASVLSDENEPSPSPEVSQTDNLSADELPQLKTPDTASGTSDDILNSSADEDLSSESASDISDIDIDIDITISGASYPSEYLGCGNTVDLVGVINCTKGNLISVSAFIKSGDTIVQSCTFEASSNRFSLAGTVNAELHFAVLNGGQYVYIVEAAAEQNGETVVKELINYSFEVVGDTSADEDTGSQSAAYTAKITQDTDNAGIVWNTLISEFYNPYAAAGIMSNIHAESSFRPNIGNSDFSNGKSYGLCQWTNERKAALYAYAQSQNMDVSSAELQAMFIIYELKTSYSSLYEYLLSCQSEEDAAKEFCYIYEQSESIGSRADNAKIYLDKYAAN